MKPIKVYITPSGPNPWKVVWIVEELELDYEIESFSFEVVKQKPFTDINPNGRVPVSGQGPYFGQASWFNVLHAEKLPSAIDRYVRELKRILGVLETSLEGREWLVGGKCSFADMAFVPWNDRIDMILFCKPEEKFEGFPNVKAWHERMTSRPSWGKIMEKKDVLMDEQGLQPNGMPKGIKSFEEYEKLIAQMHKQV
ncbi:glutathione S-transferase [Byssothecium circinans]|uniref:glutathione transferase n=1 Tax=Byssothecium circinans TaxID=147558 RepID=A0A6A5TIT3_9PLEO|nr:glutathione S-transferase [Byssothecium circinans]